MTFKRGVLIAVLLIAAGLSCFRCTDQTEQDLEVFIVELPDETMQNQILISEYDHFMQQHAGSEGMDWRFIAAIGYHESRFRNHVVSPVGAIGIMQIMPSVARSFGMTPEEVRDPENNIAVAVQLLKKIETSMRFPKSMKKDERLKVMLACYNGGIGHVLDAVRLSKKYGSGYNNWAELEKFLQLKDEPEYYNDDDVKCGPFKGDETVRFVDVVMKKYKYYCQQFPA